MNKIKQLRFITFDGSNSDILNPIDIDSYIIHKLERLMLSYIGTNENYIKLIYNNQVLHYDDDVFRIKMNIDINNEIDYIQVINCYKKYIYIIKDEYDIHIMNTFYRHDGYYSCLANYSSYYRNIAYDKLINTSYNDIIKFNIVRNNIGLWHFDNDIINNYDIILYVISRNSLLLRHVGKDMKNNYNIVLAAINNNAEAFEYASNEMKNNYDIVLAAVKLNGSMLQYAGDDMKNNYDIVLAAVKLNGSMLQYASNDMKNDFNIVSAAVRNNKLALQYVSKYMKYKYDIFYI